MTDPSRPPGPLRVAPVLAPAVLVLVLRCGGVPTGTDPVSLAFVVLSAVPVVVIGCLVAPSVRRWSYGPEFATT